MAGRESGRVRPDRVAEQIRMDVATILQSELKDPRLGLVTCTRVSLTRDLKSAKIYVSVLGDDKAQHDTMTALSSATGFVRRSLSKRLGLRAAPEIRFVFDPSVEYGIRLEELLREAKVGGADDEAPSSDEDETGPSALE